MAWTEKYANFDLATGSNDGTSEANAWQTPAAVIAGVAAGNRVNIKRQASAYNLTSTVTFNVNGSATSPIWYRAYSSTIGDGGIWECAYNSGGVADLIFSGTNNWVEGIWFKPGAATNLNKLSVSGDSSFVYRCKIENNNSNSRYMNLLRCWVSFTGDTYLDLFGFNQNNQSVVDTFIKRSGSSTAAKLLYAGNFDVTTHVLNCVLWGNGNANENGVVIDAANSGRGGSISNTRFYNFDSGILVNEEPNSSKRTFWIDRNLFDTMAAYGVERTNTEVGYVMLRANYYRNCTIGFTNYSDEAQVVPATALTSSPFADASNGDFRMNTTAGGGQVIRDLSVYMDPTASSGMNTRPLASWYESIAGAAGPLAPHLAPTSYAFFPRNVVV